MSVRQSTRSVGSLSGSAKTLWPTRARSYGLGFCQTIARLASASSANCYTEPRKARIMMYILQTPSASRPWWRTDERICVSADCVVTADCCLCKMQASETDSRVISFYDPPHGGLGCYQDDLYPWENSCRLDADPPTGAYYDHIVEIRCAEGFGCTVLKRRKSSRHLREFL